MKHKKTIVAVVSFVVMYAVFGFAILPSIIKSRLITAIEEATHRTAHLSDLSINPFALSATLHRFDLRDRDSTTLVSFSRLYVNYELMSLLRNAYVFSDVEIDSPHVALIVRHDGSMNISDLFSTSDTVAPAPSQPGKALVIARFLLTQGSIQYQDFSRNTPVRKEIDSLYLSLEDFTTRPGIEGGYEFNATTGKGEEFHWRGDVTVTPVRSSGVLEISNLRAATLAEVMGDRLKFGVMSGLLSVRGRYEFDGSGHQPRFALGECSLGISDLTLTDSTDSVPPVSLPHVAFAGISFRYPEQNLTIDSVTIRGGDLRTAYLADGTLTLAELLTPVTQPSDTTPSALTVTIHHLAASAARFTLIEKMQEPEAPMELADLAIDLSNLCSGIPGVAQLAFTGELNGSGTVQGAGTLSLDPRKLDLNLSVSGTPIAALQPYASRYSRARLESGTLSIKGNLSYGVRNAQTLFRLRCGASLGRVRITDPVMSEDLARWDRLEVKGIDYSLAPPRLSISSIVATRPYIRAMIASDRTTNIQHVLRRGPDSTGTRESTADTALASHRAPRGTVTTIGSIAIADGSMNFTDLSLTPNFAVNIQEMQGTVKGLSSEQLARANVEVTGKVDKYAPVTIQGQINPLSEEAFTDILLRFKGIELTTFSPYAGKFAGYAIDRGKLDLDLHYKLNKRFLEGSNKIVLDQLTLGKEIEGPDVTNLPVKLAIALLKDSKGVIDLDIPVSGSLNDPEFSLFPIILKAVLNALWKIVTAPFALLGSLFGGSGEDLQYVTFSPGSDSLSVSQQQKLGMVAKGLIERPALQLDVRGSASNTADKEALAEAALSGKIGASGMGRLTTPEENRLLSLYQETFHEDASGLVPTEGMSEKEKTEAIVEAAKRKLLAAIQVTESDLRNLAQRRAAAILGHLTQSAGIDPARIFLQEADITANPTGDGVRTTLNLTAR